MWEVDQDTILGLEHRGARQIFSAIWKSMEAASRGKSQMVAVDDPAIKGIFHRQVWWEALKELEEKGIIKRWREGSMWTTVMVNPFVVHPWWMTGRHYDEAMDSFRKGPMEINKENRMMRREP